MPRDTARVIRDINVPRFVSLFWIGPQKSRPCQECWICPRENSSHGRKFLAWSAMNGLSARPHPSRNAAFLPCTRPPDAPSCSARKTRSGHARQRARRRANMSDMDDLTHEVADADDLPSSSASLLPPRAERMRIDHGPSDYTSNTEPTSRASCVQPAENGLALFLHRT